MKYAFLFFFLLVVVSLQSQIKGNLKSQAGQKIELIGYDNYILELFASYLPFFLTVKTKTRIFLSLNYLNNFYHLDKYELILYLYFLKHFFD